jgi:hypothetical protein
MKKSSILWSVLVVVFFVVSVEHFRSFAAGPFQFKPNWFTIIPAIGIWAAFIALVIRKELTAAEFRTRKPKAELSPAYSCAALDDVA